MPRFVYFIYTYTACGLTDLSDKSRKFKGETALSQKHLRRFIPAAHLYKHRVLKPVIWQFLQSSQHVSCNQLPSQPPRVWRCHAPLSAFVTFTKVTRRCVPDMSTDMRDVRDALVILEAVRLNILPLIKRRLLASERDEIQSGHVYVWEEAQDDGGLIRWTDGRRW